MSRKGDCDTHLEGSLRPGDLGPEGERELGQKEGLFPSAGLRRHSGGLWQPWVPSDHCLCLAVHVLFGFLPDLTCIPWPQCSLPSWLPLLPLSLNLPFSGTLSIIL